VAPGSARYRSVGPAFGPTCGRCEAAQIAAAASVS
jgi:hypothetical protein